MKVKYRNLALAVLMMTGLQVSIQAHEYRSTITPVKASKAPEMTKHYISKSAVLIINGRNFS